MTIGTVFFTLVLMASAACPVANDFDSCVSCHQLSLRDDLKTPVQAECSGVHAGVQIGCAACHGGDANSFDPGIAMSFASRFSGVPKTPAAQAFFCGRCHESERGIWSRSAHAKTAACADCHGAHGIKKATSDMIGPRNCGNCHSYGKVSAVKPLYMQATAAAMSAKGSAKRVNTQGMGGYMAMHQAENLEDIARGIRHSTDPKAITDAARYCRDESYKINQQMKHIEDGYKYRRKARIIWAVMAGLFVLVAAYHVNRWRNLRKMMKR